MSSKEVNESTKVIKRRPSQKVSYFCQFHLQLCNLGEIQAFPCTVDVHPPCLRTNFEGARCPSKLVDGEAIQTSQQSFMEMF